MRAGGRTRSDSVRNALKYLDGEGNYELVLIHDGARPFVTEKLIKTVIRTASEKGSAVPALEPDDALKEVVICSKPEFIGFNAFRNCDGAEITFTAVKKQSKDWNGQWADRRCKIKFAK